ncbi:MAG TPA: DUF1579 domain-containing protein [Acidobacteriota bacterium]|jgi:hypothetical protein|nr:DUF1579 domain-containing protein [Acidobacteriota bacterium]HNT99596.1 DUF1579 domain-containing protein [Acidobacteriota bacterium]HPB28865.1 DUF1579 domain-containing protein [Acidobacteriota bacterium]HQP72429.1 DUF1579 domain-containing protein [Acidobacteriota bacterium]
MKPLISRSRFYGVVLILLTLGLPVWAQEPAAAKDDPMQAMMAAYARYGEIGKEHRLLHQRAGTWDVTVRMWATPDSPAEESKGTSDCSQIMGGRFILEKFESMVMGQPFSGLGLIGFDNIKKKYVAIWIDSMSTGIMASEGAPAADGKSIEYVGDLPDPVANKYRLQRAVEYEEDADHRRMEAFDVGPDGKPFRSMEMVYIRRK